MVVIVGGVTLIAMMSGEDDLSSVAAKEELKIQLPVYRYRLVLFWYLRFSSVGNLLTQTCGLKSGY